MELTIVADRWDATLGGRERYLACLAEALAKRGDSVRVLCRQGRDGTGGVAIERVGGPRRPAALADRRFRVAVAERLSKARGPVLSARPFPFATHVQLHDGLLADGFTAERESFGPGLGQAFFGIGLALNQRRQLLLKTEAEVLGGASPPHLVVFSQRLATAVTERYGLKGGQITVSSPGVDITLFSPGRGVPEGPPSLLFVAHDFGLKGLGTVFRAISRLRAVGLEVGLRVAGRGSTERWAALARRLGVGVSFLGPVAHDALPALYRESHALVHPTFHDTFSLTCAEALACGCPVVTTSRAGIAERIEGTGAGVIVEDPSDDMGLAEAVRALLEPANQRVSREAAARVGGRLDFEAHVREVRAWLE